VVVTLVLSRLKGWLDSLDAGMADFFRGVWRWCKNNDAKLDKVDLQVLQGASKGIKKERTGHWLGDVWSWFVFELCRLLDGLDNFVFYRGRIYQTKTCRVRSRGEKRLANFLTSQGVKFCYEKPLVLRRSGERATGSAWIISFMLNHRLWPLFWPFGLMLPKKWMKKRGMVIIRPDFYLPRYGVFVEFWGMMDISAKYQAIHRLKQKAYEEFGVRVISIYPQQISRLESEWPRLFKQVTGKDFPRPHPKGGESESLV